jgi:hypothetical protein
MYPPKYNFAFGCNIQAEDAEGLQEVKISGK